MRCFLIIISLILYFDFKTTNRTPASTTITPEELSNTFYKICDSNDDSVSSLCHPYYKTKESAKETGDKLQKKIEKTITVPVSAVSGFLIKSLYEKKVVLEFNSDLGKPSVSIQDNKTKVEWSYQYNF